MARDYSPITRERLERAAAALATDEREALWRHAAGELSSAELAALLGMTEPELAELVARALLKLERALVRQDRRSRRFLRARRAGD